MTCRIAGLTFVLKPTNKKVRKFYRWIMFLPYKLVCGVDPALCRNRCLCDEQVAILHLFRHQERSQLGCFCSCGCVLNPVPGKLSVELHAASVTSYLDCLIVGFLVL
jgi:hypothetical protein